MEKRKKRGYVFTLFNQISKISSDGNQKLTKVSCKFCGWTVTKNSTRMATHIIGACRKCPENIKGSFVTFIDDENIEKRKNLSKIIKMEARKVNSPGSHNSFISCGTNEDISNEFEENEQSILVENEAVLNIENEEIVENSKIVEDHSFNDTKKIQDWSKRESDDHQFKETQSRNMVTNSSEKPFKQSSVVFGNYIASEIDTIDDIDILTDLKHEISNALYNAKKEYLNVKRQTRFKFK